MGELIGIGIIVLAFGLIVVLAVVSWLSTFRQGSQGADGLGLAMRILPPQNTVRSPAVKSVRLAGAKPGRPATAKSVRPNRTQPKPPAGRENGHRDLLPADATVSVHAERREAGIDDVLASLDRDLVGLVPIKHKVDEIASLLLVDRARNKFGIFAPRPNLHMCFTGPPGTGKTTMALRMADLLHRLGYLEKGQLIHAMRDDLVGEFVGQTAPKTKRVLDRAMGGVLFIDEAYYLYRAADSKDYGQEVVDILLQVMENQRQNLVVILAGYRDRMDEFFTVNPGMRSRIAHHLDFAPYDVDELVSIGGLMLDEAHYYLSPAAEAAFRADVAAQMADPGFANARSIRNSIDRARLRHAHRLAADPTRQWSRDDLMRLDAQDIVGSELELARDIDGPRAG